MRMDKVDMLSTGEFTRPNIVDEPTKSLNLSSGPHLVAFRMRPFQNILLYGCISFLSCFFGFSSKVGVCVCVSLSLSLSLPPLHHLQKDWLPLPIPNTENHLTPLSQYTHVHSCHSQLTQGEQADDHRDAFTLFFLELGLTRVGVPSFAVTHSTQSPSQRPQGLPVPTLPHPRCRAGSLLFIPPFLLLLLLLPPPPPPPPPPHSSPHVSLAMILVLVCLCRRFGEGVTDRHSAARTKDPGSGGRGARCWGALLFQPSIRPPRTNSRDWDDWDLQIVLHDHKT